MENKQFETEVEFTTEVYNYVSTYLSNDYYSTLFSTNYFAWSEDISEDYIKFLKKCDNILQFQRVLKK